MFTSLQALNREFNFAPVWLRVGILRQPLTRKANCSRKDPEQ